MEELKKQQKRATNPATPAANATFTPPAPPSPTPVQTTGTAKPAATAPATPPSGGTPGNASGTIPNPGDINRAASTQPSFQSQLPSLPGQGATANYRGPAAGGALAGYAAGQQDPTFGISRPQYEAQQYVAPSNYGVEGSDFINLDRYMAANLGTSNRMGKQVFDKAAEAGARAEGLRSKLAKDYGAGLTRGYGASTAYGNTNASGNVFTDAYGGLDSMAGYEAARKEADEADKLAKAYADPAGYQSLLEKEFGLGPGGGALESMGRGSNVLQTRFGNQSDALGTARDQATKDLAKIRETTNRDIAKNAAKAAEARRQAEVDASENAQAEAYAKLKESVSPTKGKKKAGVSSLDMQSESNIGADVLFNPLALLNMTKGPPKQTKEQKELAKKRGKKVQMADGGYGYLREDGNYYDEYGQKFTRDPATGRTVRPKAPSGSLDAVPERQVLEQYGDTVQNTDTWVGEKSGNTYVRKDGKIYIVNK